MYGSTNTLHELAESIRALAGWCSHAERPVRCPGATRFAWLRASRLATVLSGSVGKVPNPRWGLGSRGLLEPPQDQRSGSMGARLVGARPPRGGRTRPSRPSPLLKSERRRPHFSYSGEQQEPRGRRPWIAVSPSSACDRPSLGAAFRNRSNHGSGSDIRSFEHFSTKFERRAHREMGAIPNTSLPC